MQASRLEKDSHDWPSRSSWVTAAGAVTIDLVTVGKALGESRFRGVDS
jgi:hypothetical protein